MTTFTYPKDQLSNYKKSKYFKPIIVHFLPSQNIPKYSLFVTLQYCFTWRQKYTRTPTCPAYIIQQLVPLPLHYKETTPIVNNGRLQISPFCSVRNLLLCICNHSLHSCPYWRYTPLQTCLDIEEFWAQNLKIIQSLWFNLCQWPSIWTYSSLI